MDKIVYMRTPFEFLSPIEERIKNLSDGDVSVDVIAKIIGADVASIKVIIDRIARKEANSDELKILYAKRNNLDDEILALGYQLDELQRQIYSIDSQINSITE